MLRLSAPMGCQIELTDRCPMKCIHCYNRIRPKPATRQGELSTEQLLHLLNILADIGVMNINLTGGEPMLRRDTVYAMIQHCLKRGMDVGLNTTAFNVTDEVALTLVDCGLTSTLVTILGIGETHDNITAHPHSFEQTCRGTTALVKAGIRVQVNMVVSALNIHEVEAVGRLAHRLGAVAFSATSALPSHAENMKVLLSADQCKSALRTMLSVCRECRLEPDILSPLPRCMFEPEEETEFRPILGRRICSAAIAGCVISSRGAVRPCPHNDEEFGNLLTEDFPSIWQRMECWTKPEMLPAECQACVANVVCEGGCRISAKVTTGSASGRERFMRGAIDDIDRIFPTSNSVPVAATNGPYQFNPRLRIRQESFGAIMVVGVEIEFLNEVGLQIINTLQTLPAFTLTEAANAIGCSIEQIAPMFNRLIQRKAIIRQATDTQPTPNPIPAC